MLSSIRKFSSSIYAKILLGIVVIPFVFWGMGSSFRGGNKNVIAVIDKSKVSVQEFVNFVKNNQNINEKINAEEIDQLFTTFIGNKLIENEYVYFDIKLSEKSLSKLIKIQKEFKEGNEFSRTKYEKFLITNNLNAPYFEKDLADQEKRKQLLNFIGGGIYPSKFIVNNIYNKINQKRKIELINLEKAFLTEFNYSQDEIKSYYDKNKEEYVEFFKSVKILEINPKKLIGSNDFNDVFFKKLDEIHDSIIQGTKLGSIVNEYNLPKADEFKLNKLGQDPNYKSIDKLSKDLIADIFSVTNEEITYLSEKKDKYYIVEIIRTEKIYMDFDNQTVVTDIKKKLENLQKRKLLSEIISKINQKKFLKNDFNKFSENKNIPIQKITLNNINDNKILNEMVVGQIYAFPEKKIIIANDIKLTKNFLIYIDKVIDVSINEDSEDYEKYFKLAKISITNGLFNTYDKYIKEKYEIDINYKALNTVKNYFN